MSLDVAIQSVVFYVLSCSTCTKIAHRHKAKATAKRERAEKHALETEQPGLYRHPSPFSTNPFWTEEIMLGPGPPTKKNQNGSKNTSHRQLNTAGLGSSVNSEGHTSTDAGSSPTMVEVDDRVSGEGWNRKRYQREDEELWGRESNPDSPKPGQRIRDVFNTAQTSVGEKLRALEGRLSKSGPSEKKEDNSPYFVARNPPVNDLHPPVVSTAPRNKEASQWMMQPPPPAKVMEGKERANRSRSGSRGSSQKGVDNENLTRQVTGRAVEERLRRGETPDELEMKVLYKPNSRRTQGSTTPTAKMNRTGRSRSESLESTISEPAPAKRRGFPSPFSMALDRRVSLDSIESSDGPALLSPKDNTRLTLPTIRSSSVMEASPEDALHEEHSKHLNVEDEIDEVKQGVVSTNPVIPAQPNQ